MIVRHAINKVQRDKLLSTPESHFFDGKAIEISAAKLSRSVAAFANTDGGELAIGLKEIHGREGFAWEGFKNEEAANAHIQVLEALFPLGEDFLYAFLECDGENGLVLQLLVHKTRDVKKAHDGNVYVRRGAQCLRIDSEEKMRRLELDKGIASFETETVSIGHEAISDSLAVVEFMIDAIPTSEAVPWLKKQQLIRGNLPTVAGVLLFADAPQAILPKHSGIKIYRYATKESVGSRETLVGQPLTVEGHTYSQIRDAVAATVKVIQELSILTDEGVKKVAYPHEVLHEIITNSVLHRDYSIADDVHIRIFENRIEVESPGRLPGHVTTSNILSERFARNGQIVRLINKFPDPPNKDVGEGLNTAFEAMRKLEFKDPVIEERQHSVVVHIRHEPVDPPEVLILSHLERSGQITNREARELCHIGSENKVKRIFEKLIEKNLIERVPELRGNKTAYRLVNKI